MDVRVIEHRRRVQKALEDENGHDGRSRRRHRGRPDERKGDIRARLKRLRSQMDGIERMLDDNRPCVDILTQVAAAQQAMRGVGKLVVRNYLERCASQAIKSGREEEVFDELMDVIFKLTR